MELQANKECRPKLSVDAPPTANLQQTVRAIINLKWKRFAQRQVRP